MKKDSEREAWHIAGRPVSSIDWEYYRQEVPILEVLALFDPEIDPTARPTKVKCVAPWHNDEHPSMSIFKRRNICKCWACGLSGDPISIIQKIRGVGYLEAVEELYKAGYTDGVEFEEDTRRAHAPEKPYIPKKLLKEIGLKESPYASVVIRKATGEKNGQTEYQKERWELGAFEASELLIGCLQAYQTHLAGLAKQMAEEFPALTQADVAAIEQAAKAKSKYVDAVIANIADYELEIEDYVSGGPQTEMEERSHGQET